LEVPVEFITLKYGLEVLIVDCNDESYKYKLIDPYQPSNVIDISHITDDIDNIDDFNMKIMITKLNKKIFIDNNNNICITDWLDENKLQQIINLSNKIDHDNNSSIYTVSSLNFIQEMLKDIIKNGIVRAVPESGDKIKHKIDLFLERREHADIIKDTKSSWTPLNYYILSYKVLNNQDLVLINDRGIDIWNIKERIWRYKWSNNKWNNISEKIKKILNNIDDNNENDIKLINDHFKKLLDNEFNDHKSSIPLPYYDKDDYSYYTIIKDIVNDKITLSKFGSELLKKRDDFKQITAYIMNEKRNIFEQMIVNIINDKELFIKFGLEILKIAIKENNDYIVQQTIDKIIESITSNSGNYKNSLLPFISLNLPELCQNCYSDYLIKYMAYTSIMLSPTCNFIESSRNTSLNSYLNNCIKKSNLGSNYFKFIFSLYDQYLIKSQEETRTISLIVPFPQIFCEYIKNNDYKTENNHAKIITILKNMITGLKKIMMIPKKDDNSWNEFLYKPKEILFCNIDSNNLYNWWNFAAIIDFKWKTFGWIYYSLIWFFYTIFYICYSLASIELFIADFYRGLLFIITIIFGIIQLSFEIRQCLWRPNKFFTDLWNLFGKKIYYLFAYILKLN
jgi:hypothetical protein